METGPQPPAEVRAEAPPTRLRGRELRRQSRGLTAGELNAYTRAWLYGLGALFELGDVEELKDTAPLELVEPPQR